MSDDNVYLQHIRDALADIAAYTGAGRDAFFAEHMRQDATLRKLEIIGQAVKKLSDELGSQLGGQAPEATTSRLGALKCVHIPRHGIHKRHRDRAARQLHGRTELLFQLLPIDLFAHGVNRSFDATCRA